MDKFTEALEGIKTTAGKAMDLCTSLQAQNKAQADRIAELEKALHDAAAIIRIARPYFPKSIKDSDRFALELACSTINRVLENEP